ncbi:MAG: HAMP domain-containing sensor histidine kinase, partial [Polyangiales bacterium]
SGNPHAVEMARLVLARIPQGAGTAARPAGDDARSREGDALAARVASGAHDINGKLFVVFAAVDWLRASGEVTGDVAESLGLIELAAASLRGHVRAVMRWVETQGLLATPPVFARYGGRVVAEPGLVLFRELSADVNAIQTQATALRARGGSVQEESRESIETLLLAALEISALFRDVSLSATADGADEEAACSRVDVPAFATRLAGALRVLCRSKGLRNAVLCAPEARRGVLTDGRLLARVVDNLVLNAIKYTAAGSIAVEVGLQGDLLTVRVTDTGRGIAPDALERLFDPDASDRTTRAPDSYGVGLSFVARMVAQAGGRIEADSLAGSGTTFDLWWLVQRKPSGKYVIAVGRGRSHLRERAGLTRRRCCTPRRPSQRPPAGPASRPTPTA